MSLSGFVCLIVRVDEFVYGHLHLHCVFETVVLSRSLIGLVIDFCIILSLLVREREYNVLVTLLRRVCPCFSLSRLTV